MKTKDVIGIVLCVVGAVILIIAAAYMLGWLKEALSSLFAFSVVGGALWTKTEKKRQKQIENAEKRSESEQEKVQVDLDARLDNYQSEQLRKLSENHASKDPKKVKDSILKDIAPILLLLFLPSVAIAQPARQMAESGPVCFSIEQAKKIKAKFIKCNFKAKEYKAKRLASGKKCAIEKRLIRESLTAQIDELRAKNDLLLTRKSNPLPWVLVGVLALTSGVLAVVYIRSVNK